MISAVVLAAGESRRMGTKKELLPIEGTPMIRLVVDKLLASSKIDEVIVVLGAHADEVGLALSGIIDERLELVGNRHASSWLPNKPGSEDLLFRYLSNSGKIFCINSFYYFTYFFFI